jgi:hypothetical protein
MNRNIAVERGVYPTMSGDTTYARRGEEELWSRACWFGCEWGGGGRRGGTKRTMLQGKADPDVPIRARAQAVRLCADGTSGGTRYRVSG